VKKYTYRFETSIILKSKKSEDSALW